MVEIWRDLASKFPDEGWAEGGGCGSWDRAPARLRTVYSMGHTHELRMNLSVIDWLLGKPPRRRLAGCGMNKRAVYSHIISQPLVQGWGCCRALGILKK